MDWVDKTWWQEVGELAERQPDPVAALIALARGHTVFCRRDVARVMMALRVEFSGRPGGRLQPPQHRQRRRRDSVRYRRSLRGVRQTVDTIGTQEPLAGAVVEAIHTGDLPALKRLLDENPGLAATRLADDRMSCTLLHVATDWPGHFPNGPATVALLVQAGADVNGRFAGPHAETPLHWAASSDDVPVLEALLDAGADIDAPGAVLGGGPPLADATGFGQWKAAHRLVERGARIRLADAATLGLTGRLESFFTDSTTPTPEEVNRAFWGACHGGQRQATEYLLARGADIDWLPPWEDLTPLDAADRNGATDLVRWLRSRGARPAAELNR